MIVIVDFHFHIVESSSNLAGFQWSKSAVLCWFQNICPKVIVNLGLIFGGAVKVKIRKFKKMSETSISPCKCSFLRSVLSWFSGVDCGILPRSQTRINTAQCVLLETVFLPFEDDCNKFYLLDGSSLIRLFMRENYSTDSPMLQFESPCNNLSVFSRL